MLAVTGGFGSGKSTVSRALASALGAQVINTDQICRIQLQPNNQGYNQFLEVFGSRFLLPDATINRELLRDVVFQDSRTKQSLEEILHPLVRLELKEYREQCRGANRQLVVEVPLLFEVGWQEEFDATVVVYVSRESAIQRVLIRDLLDVTTIKNILDSQLPLKEKRKIADYCIDNTGTFTSTIQQVGWLVRKLSV